MPHVHLQAEVPESELLDASEQIRRLVERDGELFPALRDLLLALDDAITDAFAEVETMA
jgi:hypothetical protein